jgi:peptidoglycan/LPS O-acetylase OafA/YrhL
MNQPGPTAKYLPTLDGWRALAVSAVMVFHAERTLMALGHAGRDRRHTEIMGLAVYRK